VSSGDALRSYDIDGPFEALADPVAQWLDWEQQANLVGFRTSTHPIHVEVTAVPRDALEIYVLPGAPDTIVDRFVRSDHVLFPRHPLNRDSTVAWFDAPTCARWSARFTASRTLALPGPESGDALLSLKLPTDHPHPHFLQPEKTRLREEALGAVQWVRTVDRIDRLLTPCSVALLVMEALVVLVRDGETGFVVRDLRSFQDGHYYLPALSLPWVGRQLAARHGQSFDAFWRRSFAQGVGRAKAELFARYGLWYETPNPQNVVLQLDAGLKPTGRIVFRDLGDGECATDAFECTDVPWSRLLCELRLETQNSFWAFGEAADHSVEPRILESWYRAHDDAYFGELGRWFPALAPAPSIAPERRTAHWSEALRSDTGRRHIADGFRARMSIDRTHER